MDYYNLSAAYYDRVYSFKDYQAETQKLQSIFKEKASIDINTVLEVACGTGNYLQFLQQDYTVEGLDISPNMVKEAQQKLPQVNIQQSDMRNFDTGKQYDSVVCLFSSIAYMLHEEDLTKAIHCMVKHLKPGGLLVIEPFVQKEKFTVGHLGALHHDWEDLKISRHNTNTLDDNDICQMDFHYLITNKEKGVQYFVEPHTMWLIPQALMLSIMEKAGLHAHFTFEGLLPNRGLFIGTL